jgi:alkanesulfonate monooxygenase SsuD/methylene tetrahydromethanopterin reductase-like flavin-dependent oxidoreductase (luciferase family)
VNEERLVPLFGLNVDPAVGTRDEAFQRARIADEGGLDLVTVQDHPYNPNFLDTWTLLVALGMATKRVHVGTNVACTPLRPPAMLAKMAASLDVLTGGRVELGLGAGGFLEGIQAFGGPAGTPGERYRAFKESLEIIRGMWAHASTGNPFSYKGQVHRLRGVHPGPAPAHPIRIWVGAAGPRMLRLTGRLADGLLISTGYVPPPKLPDFDRLVDEGAAQTGRPPTAVRRGYNLMGVLDLGRPDTKLPRPRPGLIYGPPDHWAAEILRFYRDYRQDTFIFWPVAGNELVQVEAFVRDVVPAVKKALKERG